MSGNFSRNDFVKTPEQIDDYIEWFIKRIESKYPSVAEEIRFDMNQLEISRWETNDVAIATYLITYFVNRNSKVTLDQIATYCVNGNINPGQFLYRAINEYVESRYQITALILENDKLRKALARRKWSWWHRFLAYFKGR